VNKKIAWRWIKVVVLLYAVIGIAAYYLQERLIFQPTAVAPQVAYDFRGQPHTELNLTYDEKTNLNIIEFQAVDRPKDSLAKGVVLYFHGNSGNVESYGRQATDFTTLGYEVWMIDYPGYGKSTGVHSEQKLYDYALVFYKLARSRWKPSQIILYGRSLGTGIAAELASVRDCRRLILESPYYSMTSLGGYYLPLYPWSRMLHYHFPTYSYLPDITAPVTIFQGTKDRLVPYGNAQRLRPLLKGGDEFVTIEGGGHDDLHAFGLFKQKLDSVLAL
jgi:pimeloyl-ACP methyl ester carboxylesterase